MSFTESQLKRIHYFRKSVRLDEPRTETDSAFKFTDEDLWSILEYSAPIHRGLTIDQTEDNEFYMVLLLAKREVYYRLATSSAPFFRIEADNSRIEKNMRFDHYMKLVESVVEEYEKLYEQKYGKDGQFGDTPGTNGVLTVYNAKLNRHHYLRRYHQLNELTPVNLRLSTVTRTSVNLDWDRYHSNHGADFKSYEVYVSEDMIYDEYAFDNTPIKIEPLYVINDVRRTKVRIKDLTPDTAYYVLVKFNSLIGNDSFEQKLFTTMEPEETDYEIEVSTLPKG